MNDAPNIEFSMAGCREAPAGELLFVGDYNGQRDYWDKQQVSDPLREWIRDHEVAVANLEGAIDAGEPITKQGPNLTIDEESSETVRADGFDAVSLANNHVMDFGPVGLTRTREVATDNGLAVFGAGSGLKQALQPAEFSVGDTTVGLFGVSEGQERVAKRNSSGVAWAHTPNISTELQQRAAAFDISVLVAHGGVEYVPIPPRSWRERLRGFAELGFDLVVAHHPHTPQGWEQHEGTPILYSLGNFAMYRPHHPSTQWSCVLEAAIEGDEITGLTVSLTETSDGQVRPMQAENGSDHRKYLERAAKAVSDDETYRAHWQEISTMLYDEIYHRRLSNYGLGTVSGVLNDPVNEIDQVTRAMTGEFVQKDGIVMKEYLQNPSHRCVIRTALAIQTGAHLDYRTQESRQEVETLLEHITDTSEQGFLAKQFWRLRVVGKRLSNKIRR